MSPYQPPSPTWSGSRMSFHPGCYPRIPFRQINPEIWPRKCSRCLCSGTSETFSRILWNARIRTLNFSFPYSLVTGGQVSRVDPDSMGLNPAWRNSLVFATLSTTWQDGADLTEIEAARQLLIQNMRILEGIAPESGAYLNEVRVSRLSAVP